MCDNRCPIYSLGNNLDDHDDNTHADDLVKVHNVDLDLEADDDHDHDDGDDGNDHDDGDDGNDFRFHLRQRHGTPTRATHELNANHYNGDKRLLPHRVLRMRSIRRFGMLPHRARLQHHVLPARREHHHRHQRRNNRSAFDRCPSSAHDNRDMCERLVPLRRQRGSRVRMLSKRIYVRDSQLHALRHHRHRDGAEGVARECGWWVEGHEGGGGDASCLYGSRVAYFPPPCYLMSYHHQFRFFWIQFVILHLFFGAGSITI